MYLSNIRITVRKSILDPQGKAVEHAVASLGVKGIVMYVWENTLNSKSMATGKQMLGE